MRRWQWGALLALGAGGAAALYYRDKIRWAVTGVKLREVPADPKTGAPEVDPAGGQPALPPPQEGAEGVIPDKALFPYRPLPYERIRDHLLDADSYLVGLTAPGTGEPILVLIDRVSREENVNPAFAFTRIQNEQSGWSITNSEAANSPPKEWTENGVPFVGTRLSYKLRWLLGYGRMDKSTMSRFGGWENQIVAAIRRARYLLDHPIYPKLVPVDYHDVVDAAGKKVSVPGSWVDPATSADRFYLTYTPWSKSIFETRKVHEKWFPELLA